jgi:hypothetical protein
LEILFLMDEYLDIEEAKRLIAGDWWKELVKVIVACISPFFWIEKVNKQVSNGTIFFLDTGERSFAVSAYHVYQEFLNEFTKNPDINCQLLGEKFEPNKCVIDFSEELDLITFDVDKKLVARIGRKFFTGYQSGWPPRPPEVGKGILFAGFPGIEKQFDAPQIINWGIFRGLCVANGISEKDISVQFNPEYALNLPDQIPQGYDSAGISGAPLITLARSESGINYWRLGGVIYEASSNWGIMLARRVDYILADGKIKRKLE